MKNKEAILSLPSGASLSLGGRPLIMGVLNLTPDSFYPGSRVTDLKTALEGAERMIQEGADLLDLGGESTRPGSEYVDAEEEKRRVVPVITALRRETNLPISVDTRKAEVARAALAAGADIINDVSALRDDPDLVKVVKDSSAGVILMHSRGTPKTMQENPFYNDTIGEIREELSLFAARAVEQGINKERIILDPGIGFGKRLQDNLLILKHLEDLRALGYPLLLGVSRKSFIGALTGAAVEDRLAGSLAATCFALFKGTEILRVHDVKETVQAVKIFQAILKAEQGKI